MHNVKTFSTSSNDFVKWTEKEKRKRALKLGGGMFCYFCYSFFSNFNRRIYLKCNKTKEKQKDMIRNFSQTLPARKESRMLSISCPLIIIIPKCNVTAHFYIYVKCAARWIGDNYMPIRGLMRASTGKIQVINVHWDSCN